MTTDPTTSAGPRLPQVDDALVEEIARLLVPHLFVEAGRRRVDDVDVIVQDEARWWVRHSIAMALFLGAITPGSIVGRDVAQDTLELIREVLIERGQWAAVAIVSELERTDEDGRALREPPTGPMPVVAPIRGEDALAARRARREWGESKP